MTKGSNIKVGECAGNPCEEFGLLSTLTICVEYCLNTFVLKPCDYAVHPVRRESA